MAKIFMYQSFALFKCSGIPSLQGGEDVNNYP
jgi:hypothetical protein